MTKHELIVSADDIGLSKGNTDTILEAFDHGALTSVSILANGLAFEYAIEEYQKRHEKPGLSVHLNLTEGKALSLSDEISHLTDAGGNFKHSPLSLWISYLFASRAKRAELFAQVTKEFRAQITKVREHLNLSENEHIAVDGHQHVHMIPFVFDAVASLSSTVGIGHVRIPDEPFYVARMPISSYSPRHLLGALFFACLAPRARRIAARSGISTSDRFVGLLFSGHMCENAAEAGLRAVVNQHPLHTEILFHPGSASVDELSFWKGNAAWHYDEARKVEYEYVTSIVARDLFAKFRNGSLPSGPDFPKIFRYLIAGTVAACTHLGSLYLFTEHTHLWYVYANVLAFGIGLIVSFLLQKFWTFSDKSIDRVHHQAFFYTFVQLVSLGINTGGLYILVQYLHMWYLLAEFFLLIAVAVGNFFVFSRVIFKKHGAP